MNGTKYLKLFDTHSEYQTYMNSNGKILPNVCYCEDNIEIHYNPLTWENKYFTIESLEDGNNIYFRLKNNNITPKTISISNDNGETWTSYTSNIITNPSPIATLNAGEKILIKGSNSTYANSDGWNYFSATKQYEVKGNIMSLINGDNFANTETLTGSYNFAFLFLESSKLVSAENLVLPATTLTNHCYFAMFQSCTMLTTPPSNLPATTLASSCYRQMFAYTGITNIPNVPLSIRPVGSSYCNAMYESCNVIQLPSFDAVAYHSDDIEDIPEEEEE